jgi:hypothetical protein
MAWRFLLRAVSIRIVGTEAIVNLVLFGGVMLMAGLLVIPCSMARQQSVQRTRLGSFYRVDIGLDSRLIRLSKPVFYAVHSFPAAKVDKCDVSPMTPGE